MEVEEEKKESVPCSDEEAKGQENQLLKSETTSESVEENRFSDEGMETEIEVTPDSVNGDLKRKKKKKKVNNSEEQKSVLKSDEKDEKIDCDVSNGVTNPAFTKTADDIQVSKSETRKEQYKTKLKVMRKDPCYPLYIILMCKICVVLPIAIYSCDVIIGVNVLEDPDLGLNLVKQQDNFFNVSNAPLLTVIDHPYSHKIPNTVLRVVQRLSKERTKRQTIVEEVEPTELDEITTTAVVNNNLSQTITTTMKSEVHSTLPALNTEITSTATFITDVKEKPEQTFAVTEPEMLSTENYTSESNATTNGTNMFCQSELYFVQQHEELSNKSRNYQKKEYDWYVNMNNVLFQYQQALFFMFTVVGFILLLTSMGSRVDAILNEKWSSSLLINFIFYTISMALTAKVFALQSGSNGVRCFLCQMVSFCDDIDPWDLTPNIYFPTEMNWNTVAFVSFILKIYDCFVIGIITLKYILNFENDAWWAIILKIFGWILVFPLMIITPMAGVFRYSVLPVTAPENDAAKLGFEAVFYIGVVFWVLALIILPFFCKIRMCNKSDDYDEEEEYY